MKQARKGPKQFRVGVFKEEREGRKPLYSAYTMWYDPEWKNCVGEYNVEAANGEEAKKIAIGLAKLKHNPPAKGATDD
jgi:hypothetical protein